MMNMHILDDYSSLLMVVHAQLSLTSDILHFEKFAVNTAPHIAHHVYFPQHSLRYRYHPATVVKATGVAISDGRWCCRADGASIEET